MMSGYLGLAYLGETPRATDGRWLAKVGLGTAELSSSFEAATAQNTSFHCWSLNPSRKDGPRSRLGHRLFFTGAIHNRSDLVRRLGDAATDADEDASIVMSAYLKWGTHAFAELIGEFSLALWEPREKTVFLVRDTAGTQPLFYRRDGKRLLFSTDIRVLLTDPTFHPVIEDGYVAGFLSCYVSDTALTPYKGIHAVRPATFLAAAQNGSWREETYWRVDASQCLRYKSDRQYDEHFRSLFADAVRERLRSRHPILADLSGGLDSSSIVCLADRIVDPSETPLGVETISYVYDESPSCDERVFIRAVEEGRGHPGHHLRDSEHRFQIVLDGTIQHLSHPECCIGGIELAREGVVLRTGARRVLSGEGGDEVMGGTTRFQAVIADFLVRSQLRQCHRQILEWARIYRQPYVKLLLGVARTALPRWPLGRGTFALPSWYRADFVKRTHLGERALLPSSIDRIKLPSARDQAAAVWSAVVKISGESQHRKSSAEYSYPYLHRPLLEFMQAIPPEQKLLPGRNRVLMRRALKEVLPDAIAERKGKAFGNENFHRCLVRQWSAIQTMFEDNRFLSQEYVDPKAFLPVLDRCRHGLDLRIGAVLRVLMLESWLRNLSGYSPEWRRSSGSRFEARRLQTSGRLAAKVS